MLRQPSQSSTTSSPIGVISGIDQRHQRHAALPAVVVVIFIVVVGSEAGDEQPQALVHLRRRQPDPLVLAHRLEHVVDQLLTPRGRMSAGSTARARARSTGWPMRATLRIAMSGLYSSRRCRYPRSTASARRAAAARDAAAEAVGSGAAGVHARAASSSISIRRSRSARSSAPPTISWCWCGGRSNRATGCGCSPAATSIAARRSRPPRGARRGKSPASTSASIGLINIYSYGGRSPIIVVYAATIAGRRALRRRRVPRRAAVRPG